MNNKELSNFNSISEVSDNSYILSKDLLWSNEYINSILEGEDLRNNECNIKRELEERKVINNKNDRDFNLKLVKGYGVISIVGSGLIMGGMLIKNRVDKLENKEEKEEREKLKNKRVRDLYKFGDNFKNSGKVVNGVGKFFGKGIFKCIDLLDKIKL